MKIGIKIGLAYICALLAIKVNAQQKLMHYWHFNSFTGVGAATNPATLIPYRADFTFSDTNLVKVSYVTLPGTPTTYTTYWDNATGDTVNLRLGVVAGNCLRLRNPSDNMQLKFYVPTTLYKNITIKYEVQKSSASNGAANNIFAYSVDSGLTWRTSGLSQTTYTVTNYSGGNPAWPITPVTVNITDTEAFNNPKLVFRITFAGAGSTSTSGNNRIDNFSVEGDTIVYPTLYVNHNLSTFLASKNGQSNAQQIIVSGVGLLDTVWLNTNGDFKMASTQNGIYSNALYLLPQNKDLVSTVVYVKFFPTDTGTFLSNLTTASLMATNVPVALQGSTLPLPVITVSGLPLQMFTKAEGQNRPLVQTFSVNAQNLTDTLWIKSKPPFYISTDTIGMLQTNNSLFFTDSNITQQTIYVWFDAILFNTFADTVVITSAGAITQLISMNGKFVQTPFINFGGLPLDTFAEVIVGSNAIPQAFIITSEGLTAPLTITVAKPFSISLPGEIFKNQLTISVDSGKINTIVYVKFNPTQLGTVSDSIVINSIDLGIEIIPVVATTFDPFKGLTSIYRQDFTSATNRIPASGWQISDTALWSIISSNPSANYAYASGTNCLRFDNEASELPKTATTTISGKINTQFYKDVKVTWGARRTNNFFNGIVNSKAFLLCSTNDNNWDTVYYKPEPNNSDLWSYVNDGVLITLPATCNHKADVKLRWLFTSEGLGSSGTYRLDDIWVFATLDTLTGIIDQKNAIKQLAVYPNPANFELTIQAEESLSLIEIFDITGSKVMQTFVADNKFIKMNIATIKQGLYVAHITSKKGNTVVQKIIVTK